MRLLLTLEAILQSWDLINYDITKEHPITLILHYVLTKCKSKSTELAFELRYDLQLSNFYSNRILSYSVLFTAYVFMAFFNLDKIWNQTKVMKVMKNSLLSNMN